MQFMTLHMTSAKANLRLTATAEAAAYPIIYHVVYALTNYKIKKGKFVLKK